jgi:acetyl-CoA synthetase
MDGEWTPDKGTIDNSNIATAMARVYLNDYQDFYNWSITKRESFWVLSSKLIGIIHDKRYEKFLDLSDGIENPHWLKGGQLNIAKSCFTSPHEAIAIKFQEGPNKPINYLTYGQLKEYCNRIANSLKHEGLTPGDAIAIDMPMTAEAVAIYLAAILFGAKVITIADSFSSEEIKTRLSICPAKLIFTQDLIRRSEKSLDLYEKIKKATSIKCIVIPEGDDLVCDLIDDDQDWSSFLSEKKTFAPHSALPEDIMTILFSSGTTGSPKAIPWDHTTPIKAAVDGFYHHNIQQGDTICWPTNLGWMMGPWLVFATLINKGTIALYYDSPHSKGFGDFIDKAEVNMLGVIPSLVSQWKATQVMEGCNWQKIKCFSSTGECSNEDDMSYLMKLAGNKPVIEYCGGTEIGGGYVTGTMVQEARAATFSTPALGSEFILLDEKGEPSSTGEVFLIPPIMGLSNILLNRDHHEVYYQDCPKYQNKTLRRHGDQLQTLENGSFKALGRIDDSINLGGIKVSSTQIEELINKLPEVKECAAIAVPPIKGGPTLLKIFYVSHETTIDSNTLFEKMKLEIKTKLNPLFKIDEALEINALPRTASNKVMRRQLRQQFN